MWVRATGGDMRALGISRYGDETVMERWEIPVPVVGSDQVLVRVHYAGVNFMDIHTRQGKYANSRTYRVGLPVGLGMEGAGEVIEVGPDVHDVVPGERVAWCLSWGSYAEVAVVPRARLAHVPDDIGLDVAAASLFSGCTAHYLVHDVAQVAAGMTCLVHAASGTIGQLLVQMAAVRGARVLATTSTEPKAAVARAKGAGEAFVYDNGGFVEDVLAATGGRGVDVSFDAVGAPTLRASLRCTRPRGLVVNYGSVGGAVHDLDPLELGEGGSLFLTRPRLADYIATRDELQRRSVELFEGIRLGAWGVDIADVVTLDEAGNALSQLEGRRRIGKALVRIAG